MSQEQVCQVGYLRKCLSAVCRQVAETGAPVVIRRYRCEDVILVRLSDWQRLNAMEPALELQPIACPEIDETAPAQAEHPDRPA